MKLIKLSESHYIVVDDSEIKEGWKGWAYKHDVVGKVFEHFYTTNKWYQDARKITYSTQPLEGDEFTEWFDFIKPVFLSEVEELTLGYSVEKMANLHAVKSGCEYREDLVRISKAYQKGFNDHRQLVKNKLFSVEDMRKVFEAGFNFGEEDEEVKNAFDDKSYNKDIMFDKAIQSLLPPTEWEVTFDEKGKLKLIN